MRLQVESEVVVFALDSARQRLPTARAADSKCYAHSAGPIIEFRIFAETFIFGGFQAIRSGAHS